MGKEAPRVQVESIVIFRKLSNAQYHWGIDGGGGAKKDKAWGISLSDFCFEKVILKWEEAKEITQEKIAVIWMRSNLGKTGPEAVGTEKSGQI